MHAIILSIGDELALGQTVDTNSAWLSARLASRGIPTLAHETVADDLQMITDAIRWAADHARLVIISGGIGPTEDDMTRQALADAMNAKLVTDPASLSALEAFFASRGREMSPINKVQARHPEGSKMVPNACGTAPGMRAQLADARVYVTPGVPREMKAMYTASIEPEVLEFAGVRDTILTTKVNTFGVGESAIAEALGDLMDRKRNPKVGTTVAEGMCSVRVRSEFPTQDRAQAAMADTVKAVRERLGAIVFGQDDDTLQQTLVAELAVRRLTVASAESCTGGLIGAMLTDVAGSSQVYAGGWVTYSNAMKHEQLGVPEEILNTYGAVSPQVVRCMASGAISCSEADLAVSVSGIAGPGGGTEDKPVGTVYFGFATRGADGSIQSDAYHAIFAGARDTVRDRTAKSALQLIRLHVMGEPATNVSWLTACV